MTGAATLPMLKWAWFPGRGRGGHQHLWAGEMTYCGRLAKRAPGRFDILPLDKLPIKPCHFCYKERPT